MHHNASHYQIGRLAVSIEGQNAIAQPLTEELASARCLKTGSPHIRFMLSSALPDGAYRRAGGVLALDNGLRIDGGPLSYDISNLAIPFEIAVGATSPRWTKMPLYYELQRFRHWNYLHAHEEMAKNFIYNIFDWTTQVAQLQLGQSYLHASAMARDDRALAILAWGGVGKTTSMLKFCIEDGWQYLSDDLAIIDVNGIVYRSPKKLQIYGYNLQGETEIRRRLLRGRSLTDLVAWYSRLYRYGPKLVRRRVSPESLFGTSGVAEQATLTDLVFLERTNLPVSVIKPISGDEVAERMAAIVMAEVEPYTTLYRQAVAAGARCFIDPATVQATTCGVLRRAFARLNAVNIQVGIEAGPQELARILRTHIA